MDMLKYRMEWKNFPYLHRFSIFAHFNVFLILSAVNKIAFDQTHKMIKKVVAKNLFQ